MSIYKCNILRQWRFYITFSPPAKNSSKNDNFRVKHGQISKPQMEIISVAEESSDNNSSVGKPLCNDSAKDDNIFETKVISLQLLSDDWSKNFGSEEFSDVDVLLRSEIIPCHKLVFKTRCPAILVEVNCFYTPNAIDLSNYSPEGAKAFLNYIYTGKTDKISFLPTDGKRDLAALANKYNVIYLHSLITSCIGIDPFYNQSTCSPPHSSPESNLGSLQKVNSLSNHNLSKNKSGLENVEVKTQVQQVKHESRDEQAILLSDSSADSVDKHFQSEKQITESTFENKTPEGSCSFGLLSKRSLSPDLFDSNTKNAVSLYTGASTSSSHSKRKICFQETHDEVKKICVNKSDSISQNTTDNGEVHITPDIVNLDSDSEEGQKKFIVKYPKFCNTTDKSKEEQKISSESSNDSVLGMDNSFHLNFDINEYKDSSSNHSTSAVNKTIFIEPCGSSGKTSPLSCDNNNSSYENDDHENKPRSSLQKYLQDTFPSFTEDLMDIETISKPLQKSTPSRLPSVEENVTTPKPQIIINEASPDVNYSSMSTPELKNHAAKYGLKQTLDRKKYEMLIPYIHRQTHSSEAALSSTPSTSKKYVEISSSCSSYSSDDSN